MTTWSDRLALIVTADTKGAVAGLEAVGTTAERELTKAQTKLDATGRNLTRLGVGSIAAGAVIGAGLYKAAQAYDEANKASLQLENTIRNQPALAGANAKALEGLAQSIQHKTAADGDEIVAGMAKLGMYGANQAAIEKLTPLVVDYARKTGKDLVTAFADVGKALQGKTKALAAAGVQIDANTYATDRLKAITEGLRTSVGNFAEDELKNSLSAQLEQARNNAMDLAEGLGKGVAQAIGDLSSGLDTLTEHTGSFGEESQAAFGRAATYGAGILLLSGAVSVTAGQSIKFAQQIKGIPALLDTTALKALYAKDAFTSLGGSMAASAATGFIPLAAVAATVGAFMVADKQKAADLAEGVKELGAEAQRTGRSLETEFLAALKQLRGEGTGPLDDALGHTAGAFKQFADETGLSAEEINKHIGGSKESFEKWRDAQAKAATQSAGTSTAGVALGRALDRLRAAYEEAGGASAVAAQSQADYEASLGESARKAKELADAEEKALASKWAYGEATTALADAQDAAQRATAESAKRVADADRSIVDAQRDVRDAHQAVVDSYRELDDAAKKYQDRVAGLQDTIEGGQISQERAQVAVAKAQQAYDAAVASGDPVAIRDADLDLRDARLQLKRANNDLADAQGELNQANRDGLANSPEMLDAQKRIKDAKDRETDATAKLKQAEKDRQAAVEESAKAVEDANGKILDAIRKQEEAYLILYATLKLLNEERRYSGQGYIVGGTNRGGKPDDPAGANGGRSAIGPKLGTTVNVYVDGATKTTHAAIEAGARKGTKQAILAYNRRAA